MRVSSTYHKMIRKEYRALVATFLLLVISLAIVLSVAFFSVKQTVVLLTALALPILFLYCPIWGLAALCML